jgi:hypothetical protein
VSQEQRIVEKAAQPAEPVADRRRREVELRRRPAHVSLRQHGLEEDEKVEIDARKVNLIQHIAEIISLDSVSLKGDPDKARSRVGCFASAETGQERPA